MMTSDFDSLPTRAADPLAAPPHAVPSPSMLELERGLLGAALLNPEAIPIVLRCSTSVFAKDVHRDILEWVRCTATAGEQPDAARLTLALEQLGHPNAADIVATMLETAMLVPLSGIPGYIRELRAEAVKRLVAQRGRGLTLDALANRDGPSAAVLLGDLESI